MADGLFEYFEKDEIYDMLGKAKIYKESEITNKPSLRDLVSRGKNKLKENDDPDYESEYAADLFKNALHREMNQNDSEAIESLLEEGLTYTEALEQYVHECVSKLHESRSTSIQRLTEAALREWAVKDYFSKSELEKTDKLPDETLDDKIKAL